jgi:hypothetical protein
MKRQATDKTTEKTMTTIDVQDEAKRIWDEMDAADSGNTDPVEIVAEGEQGTAQAAPTEALPEPTDDMNDPKMLRDKLANMEAMVQQLGGRLRNAEGHIGGLNSQLKSQLEAAKAVVKSGGDAPSAKELRDAQGDPEAMADLARDYPELAKALRPAMEATFSERFKELEKRLPTGVQEGGLTRQELNAFRSEMLVESSHKGWQEVVRGDEFKGWLSSSPREFQLLAASDAPADAIRLLDQFNESKKEVPLQKNQRLSSAAAMPTGQRSPARTKNVDDMTAQEFWRYQDQLDKQKA